MIKYKKKGDSAQQIQKILHPIVKKWFFSRFKEFSLPQLYGVMEIHSRNNVLVSAPTGATKTLTAFLSILNELIDSSEKGILEDRIYCVYVSPLKALNNDVERNLKEPLEEMEKIAEKEFGIRIAVRTGDTTASEKSKMLRKPPHILITTPESLSIVLSSKKFKEHLRNADWCVVDEIHALAENKRGVHLSVSLERLQNLSQHLTRVGLSATVAPLDEITKFLVGYQKGKPRRCKVVNVQFMKKMDLKVLSPAPDLIDTTHQIMHGAMYNLMDNLIQQHQTTLIFTNTRSATERVVDHLKERFPKNYSHNIGAHHGSLSKSLRHQIEKNLREGKLKVIVSSTSLELGIDIGYIELVILLGSPKSVARGLQRVGRSGHRLHDTTRGRIMVLDRDDLVENSVLLKEALEEKIDRVHIPTNCLDVLSQHIYGIAISRKLHIEELYQLIKQSYCYKNLSRKDFMGVIEYLSGKYTSLEDRHIYAKIWYDEETGMIGRKGRLARVLYMTNIGTIPEETYITVKVGDQVIGKIDEAFLERLRKGDVFVLGGEKYEFVHARGMVAQVRASTYKPPTIPSWFSEMLPLSFDLAMEISRFRRLMEERLSSKKSQSEILGFINRFLNVDRNAARAIYRYMKEQHQYAVIPHDKKIVIESYYDGKHRYAVFHTLFGRRVNDCLSRAVAFIISRLQHINVGIGVTDNGFYLRSEKRIQAEKALRMLKTEKLDMILKMAIENTEVLRRRFRHCATRALMILRSYKGKKKRVGRQQVSSRILISAVKRINPDFSILQEARREVLEDLMDSEHTREVVEQIQKNQVKVEHISTTVPSPFAFNLVIQGYTDLLKMDDRIEFLKRMHQMVLAKISQKGS